MTHSAQQVNFYTGALSVAVLLSLGAAQCGGAQKPVDTSQQILVEAGSALADIDAVVAARSSKASQDAITVAVANVRLGRCNESESSEDCVVRHLQNEMELWYQLTGALEAAHGTLTAWQAANAGWRQSGERPPDWNARVCVPVGIMTQTIVALLSSVDIPIPDGWQKLILQADKLCSLGVVVAEMAGPSKGGE